MVSKYKGGGWYKESWRHGLAAKGIPTSKYMASKSITPKVNEFALMKRRYFQDKDVVESQSASDDFEKANKTNPEKANKLLDNFKGFVDTFGGRGELTPGTVDRRFREAQNLQSRATAFVKSQRDVSTGIEQAKIGNTGEAVAILKSGKTTFQDPDTGHSRFRDLTEVEREDLQTSLENDSVRRAQEGRSISDTVKEFLSQDVKSDIDAIQNQRKIERESPFKTALKSEAARAAVEAVDLAVEAPGKVVRAVGEIGREGLAGVGAPGSIDDFPGLLQKIDEADSLPFFKDNVFIGADTPGGPSAFGGREGTGFGLDPGQVPSLSQIIGENLQPISSLGPTGNVALQGGGNVALGGGGEKPKTMAELTQQKVDSLAAAKADLSRVDTSAFEKGTKAFEKGDREGLIKSITELQSHEATLKDRWDMLNITRAQVVSRENHESAFQEKDGILAGVFGSKGGGLIADQTKKLEDVRGDVLKANNEVFTRRKMLEFRLKRLDSTVPPETDVPSKVDRFGAKSTNFSPKAFIREVPNIAIDGFLLGGGK